jgi:hypothetical protein
LTFNCIKDETVADYLEGRLPEEERQAVEEHLSECDRCLEAVVSCTGLSRDGALDPHDPVPEKVTEDAIQALKALDRGPLLDRMSEKLRRKLSEMTGFAESLWPRYGLALAPVRGFRKVVTEDLVLIRKAFSGFEAEIEIEKVKATHADVRVTVKVKGPDGSVRVSLVKGEREVSSQLTDGATVLFEDIPFDHYQLVFSRDGARIGEYAFQIKGGGHGGR